MIGNAPRHTCDEERERSLARLCVLIGALLRAGVWGSLFIVCAGVILTFIQHPSYFNGSDSLALLAGPATAKATLAQIVAGVLRFDGPMIVMLGLVLLIATPIIRVALSIGNFIAFRDRAYFFITAAVMLLLALSFWMGNVKG